jgi:SAM-dependent methyltransferase
MQSIVFDRAVDYYDETRGFPPGVEVPAIDLFVQAGHLTPDSRVLEVGIGTGRIALPLASRVRQIVGIDLSRGMMDRLRAKRTTEPIRVVEANAMQLPLASDSFDAVVAVHVFHLIEGWREALQEAARVLRPGGMLLAGYNDRSDSDDEHRMWKIWNDVTHIERPKNVGIQRDQYDTFWVDAGWTPASDKLSYHFSVENTPERFLNQLERRIWSNTWRMSDEEVARGLKQMRAYFERKGTDLKQPYQRHSNFTVRAYLPPE